MIFSLGDSDVKSSTFVVIRHSPILVDGKDIDDSSNADCFARFADATFRQAREDNGYGSLSARTAIFDVP